MSKRLTRLTLHHRTGTNVMFRVGYENIIGSKVKDIRIVGGRENHGPVVVTFEDGEELHAVDIPYTFALHPIGKVLHSYPTNNGEGTSKGATARRNFTRRDNDVVMDETAEKVPSHAPYDWFTDEPQPGHCGFGPCVLDGDHIWILEDEK